MDFNIEYRRECELYIEALKVVCNAKVLHSSINPLMCFRLLCTKSAIKVLIVIIQNVVKHHHIHKRMEKKEIEKNRSWHTKRMRCYALATMIWNCWFVGFMRLHFHFYRIEISLRLFLFGWIYVQISSFSYANTKYTTIRNKKHSANKLPSLLHFNANIFLDQIHRVHIYIIWWKEIHCVKCFD